MAGSRAIHCDYCGQPAVLLPDSAVYARGYGSFVWVCKPCGAHVGTHRASKWHAPLGRLANAELRALKIEAHQLFDGLWRAAMVRQQRKKHEARNAAYAWLTREMQAERQVHIGYMGEAETKQVIAICAAVYAKSGQTAREGSNGV